MDNQLIPGTIVHYLKKPYFSPDDREDFRRRATAAHMSVNDYCRLVTGYDYIGRRTRTDENLKEFLEANVSPVDGKVHFNVQGNTWFKNMAEENGMKIGDLARLYGFEYGNERGPYHEGGIEAVLQEELAAAADENGRIGSLDRAAMRRFTRLSAKRGMSAEEYAGSLGYTLNR